MIKKQAVKQANRSSSRDIPKKSPREFGKKKTTTKKCKKNLKTVTVALYEQEASSEEFTNKSQSHQSTNVSNSKDSSGNISNRNILFAKQLNNQNK